MSKAASAARLAAASGSSTFSAYSSISSRTPADGAWARLTGRAPISAAAAEYRRLSDKIRDNDARSKAFLASARGLSAGVREEMLEHYYETMAPEFESDGRALTELLKAHPNAEYEASGPIRRLFMRLTGRGPKS